MASNSIDFHKKPDERTSPPASNQQIDDAVLWKRFKEGNESAFIEIYRSFFDVLFNFGCQFCAREDLIEDTIQDLFLELRRKRTTLGDTDNIKFYLLISLKRKLIRELSKWYNKLEGFSGEIKFQITLSHEEMLIQSQIDADTEQRLDRAIQGLPPKKKEVLYYFYYENLSYAQIKELMEFSHVKSVRNLLYETIGVLRKQLRK